MTASKSYCHLIGIRSLCVAHQIYKMVDLRTGKVALIFSGIFALLSYAINLSTIGYSGDTSNVTSYWSLESNGLRDLWDARRRRLALQVLSNATAFVSYWLLLYGIYCVVKMFGKYSSGMARAVLRGSFIIGSIVPAVEILQNLGVLSAGIYISGHSGVPDAGFQILEVSYLMMYARSVWLFSVTYLFHSIGVLTVSYLTFNENDVLSRRHGVLGIFVGIEGIIVFILSIFIFYNSTVFLVWAVVALIWGALLYPSWLFWLSHQVHQASKEATNTIHDLEELNRDI